MHLANARAKLKRAENKIALLQEELYVVQNTRIKELEQALIYYRDNYTGCEPSVSVFDRMVHELIGEK